MRVKPEAEDEVPERIKNVVGPDFAAVAALVSVVDNIKDLPIADPKRFKGAHSDDCDHPFRSIATTRTDASRPPWWSAVRDGMIAAAGSSVDVIFLGLGQAGLVSNEGS